MAATKSLQRVIAYHPYVIERVYLTNIVAGAPETITYTGVSGVNPYKVEFIVTQRPTTRDPVICDFDRSESSDTSNTIVIHIDTIPGGDLTGAEVMVLIHWLDQGDGGLTAP